MREARNARRTLAIVLVAAMVLHLSSLLIVALLVLPTDEAGRSLLLWPLAGVAFVLSATGVVWGALSLTRIRPQETRPRETRSKETRPQEARPVPVPEPVSPGESTVINPRRQPHTGAPSSPDTPADAELQQRTGRWTTSTTPWPRADEDDPHGTLIRPPHR